MSNAIVVADGRAIEQYAGKLFPHTATTHPDLPTAGARARM